MAADLPYYVTTYHVELPDEFVADMRRNGWTVPVLSRAEELQLSQQLYRDMGGEDAESGATSNGGPR